MYSGTNRSNVSSGGLMLIFQVPNGFLQQQVVVEVLTPSAPTAKHHKTATTSVVGPCPRARLSHAAFRVKAPQCLWSLSAWLKPTQVSQSWAILHRIKYPLHRHFKRCSGCRVSQHEHDSNSNPFPAWWLWRPPWSQRLCTHQPRFRGSVPARIATSSTCPW